MSTITFFRYFGGKKRIAPRYPEPKFPTIIEPFAGAAGYAQNYPDRKVLLIDKSEKIVGVWDYLIHVKEKEFLKLPMIKYGQSLLDLPLSLPIEAHWFLGFWIANGVERPRLKPSPWLRDYPDRLWNKKFRARLAGQLASIRHWKIKHGSFEDAPDRRATWFIDPPYMTGGKAYPESEVDYKKLASFCRSRAGQTMVCEAGEASWLPFKKFFSHRINSRKGDGNRKGSELLWYRET